MLTVGIQRVTSIRRLSGSGISSTLRFAGAGTADAGVRVLVAPGRGAVVTVFTHPVGAAKLGMGYGLTSQVVRG